MIKNKTKKGAASIYAVVFVTLLLGIITMSFVRLILRESTDSSNSELSSSSRDAALAGVEDAKRAIVEYEKSGSAAKPEDCNFVSKTLYNTNEEVLLKEDSDQKSKTLQAYTCVTVDPEVDEYRGSLDSTNSVAVIPLKTAPRSDPIDKIEFSWQLNDGSSNSLMFPNKDYYQDKDSQSDTSKQIAPVVSFQYIKAGSDISVNNYDPYSSDSSIFFLTPAKNKNLATSIDLARNSVKNSPTKVNCSTGSDYLCNIVASNASNTKYLVVSLPYGLASTGDKTDFQVRMLDASDQIIPFYGVQYLVDSTGRANDLYTRVEVRLNKVDPDFPYPQFALQTKDKLDKYFWVTEGCKKVDNGKVTDCKNSGNL